MEIWRVWNRLIWLKKGTSWQAVVGTVINFQFLLNVGNFLTA